MKYGNVVYVVLLLLFFLHIYNFPVHSAACVCYTYRWYDRTQLSLHATVATQTWNKHEQVALENIQKEKYTHETKVKKIQVHDFTSISIALVGVDG